MNTNTTHKFFVALASIMLTAHYFISFAQDLSLDNSIPETTTQQLPFTTTTTENETTMITTFLPNPEPTPLQESIVIQQTEIINDSTAPTTMDPETTSNQHIPTPNINGDNTENISTINNISGNDNQASGFTILPHDLSSFGSSQAPQHQALIVALSGVVLESSSSTALNIANTVSDLQNSYHHFLENKGFVQDSIKINSLIQNTLSEYIPLTSRNKQENASDVIIHDANDLQELQDQGLIISSFLSGESEPSAIFVATDISMRTPDNSIQINMPESVIIASNDGGPLPLDNFSLEKDTGSLSNIIIQGYDPQTNTYQPTAAFDMRDQEQKVFHFGIENEHLHFSKPLEVTIYSQREDGSSIAIQANHANQGRTNEGISTDPNTTCNSGHTSIAGNIAYAKNNTITFYICSASSYALTYVGGVNTNNFCDNTEKTKTVEFLTGVRLPTGHIITDVDISIRRRPIDSRDPTRFNSGDCGPGEKYFMLIHPDNTTISIINTGQLSQPNPNCPETTTIFDMSGSNTIGNDYSSGTYKPVQSFTGFNGKSPFGVRGLKFGDNAFQKGVILYAYTLTLTTTTGDMSSGSVCISAPNSFITGTQVTSTTGIIEHQFDYFTAQGWLGQGRVKYYTTLNISNLQIGTSSNIIGTSNIQRKADALTMLSGANNTDLKLSSSRSGYQIVQANRVFMQKTGTTFNKDYIMGSKLRLKIAIPPFSAVGTYSGVLTYTLYQEP